MGHLGLARKSRSLSPFFLPLPPHRGTIKAVTHRLVFASVFLALTALPGLAVAPQARAAQAQTAPSEAQTVEVHRLRIVNEVGGAIQVSSDGGQTFRLIGRVLAPATTVSEGYTAAQYAQPGTVAAIAVHGLRVRVGEDDAQLHDPLVLSIDPKEYASGVVNTGFGGHAAGSAGIFTDIPAGTSLFRELAPSVGDRVFLESGSGRMFPLPSSFRPAGKGEVLVIPVRVLKNALTEVIFPNKAGAPVEATYVDGHKETVTQVIRPVLGVGRFDGTSYTGLGRLNTAHTGVLTVSTVPRDGGGGLAEGEGKERRGGFQIAPAWHNARTEEAGSPQTMTLGQWNVPRKRELEGAAPLFRSAIGLGDALEGGASVFVSIDSGPWEPMPTLVGLRPAAFTAEGLNTAWKEQNVARTCQKGVTAFRLTFPLRDPARSNEWAQAAAQNYTRLRFAQAKRMNTPIVNGTLTIAANPTNRANVAFVRLMIEGVPRGLTNVSPFTLSWDTTRVSDGEYMVQADALDESGNVVAVTKKKVFVRNDDKTGTASLPK